MGPIRRLHFGCGTVAAAGWINVDVRPLPGVHVRCDLICGLPLGDDSIDYISSQHALQDVRILDHVRALAELRRVLRPGAVLRLGLPVLDRAIEGFIRRRQDYFYARDWDTVSGNFVTHILWYN